MRKTQNSATTSFEIAGRPGRRPAYVHRLRTRRRCQPSSVSGRTKNDCQLVPLRNPAGRREENAVAFFQLWTGDLAAKNRQLVSKHHDLKLLELAGAQPQRATASARRNNRYSNDTTKKRPPFTRTERSRLYGGETNVDAPWSARRIYAPHGVSFANIGLRAKPPADYGVDVAAGEDFRW